MKVDINRARTPKEEYTYWFDRLNGYIDEKLPWDMHPNEMRASDMYYAKMRRKIKEAVDLIHEEEHTVYLPPE